MYSPINRRKKLKLFRRRKINAYHFNYTSSGSKTSWLPSIYLMIKEKGLLKLLLYTVLILFLLTGTLFLWYSKDLPNPYKINRLPIAQSTKILDRNGQLLYEIHGEENRTLIKFEDMPESIKKATIALEDEDFYKHSGFNLKGILRAFIYDFFHRQPSQGGSTITQQYVKNALLTSKKSISRKIKELILSLEIEKIYSKDEILAMYLNEIPYGNNAYGIQAAAQTYFGKDARDLTLAESALLASLPQAPTYYNPYGSNSDILMKRKDFTLDKMAELKLISKEEAKIAKQEEIKLVPRDHGILAPHFVMYVKELLAEEYGEETLQKGGLVVTTSLDLEKQKLAEEAMEAKKANLQAKGAKNAALVSMDPKTGQILAMVGSIDYFDTENDGNVNVALRLRQPGSSIKPIIYAAAFEKGYSPATLLMDVKTDFGNNYIPQNYDHKFRGPVSMRSALGNSLNIPAVKTLQLVGVRDACNLAQKMGIKSLNDPDRYGLSLVLGGGEVKLMEMVQAYSVFANYGLRHDITPILKIEDSNGKILFEYKKEEDKGQRVLDENIAAMISDVLSDDSARTITFGAGSLLTLYGRPVAAKTGTTDEYRDGWTIGYTPSLVTGVWAGNNDNSQMKHGGGYTVAAPIWNYYMNKALAGTPVENFKLTDGIEKVTVDALTGMLPLENIPEELKEALPTKKEIFLSDAKPQIQDNVHKIIRVIKQETKENKQQETETKEDGLTNLEQTEYKIAGDDCPIGMTEYKLFLEFHSIRSDLPNWENAVIKWAEENGYNNVPTEIQSCEDFVKENKPEITIISPKNNQSIDDKLSVIISYKAPKIADKVEYFLDEEKIAEVDKAPFNLTSFNLPSNISGKITLKAQLTDKVGLTASDSITIKIKKNNPNNIIINLIEKEEREDFIIFSTLIEALPFQEIDRVEFYVNNELIDKMEPVENNEYLYNWSKEKGLFVFFAKVYLKNGESKQSENIIKNIE